MKSILIIIGKSFILFSACFLCYTLIFQIFEKEKFIESIIYPSLFLTIILTIIHIVLAVRVGVKYNFSSIQSEKINKSVDLEELINKIDEKSDWELIEKNNNSLTYKSNFQSMKSFGEIISIQQSGKEIIVSSKPSLFTTIFDFGKNYENVNLIKSVL